ncbi:MAG: hypothetical protein GX087_07725 [Desulfobulbaceae bacterium]|nr:hypothetical protein [Desulfobulbaceae bacterium]
MQRLLLSLTVLSFSLCSFFTALPLQASTSIIVDEPGFYGRLDLGGYPSPRLIYPDAIIVDRVAAPPPPAYLRVPPGHAKKWSKHCHRYNACGQPVFFVDDDWYNNIYVPRYREIHGVPGPMRVQPGQAAGTYREVRVKEQRQAVQTRNPGQVKVKQARNNGNSGKAYKANKGNKGNKGNGNPGKGNSGKGNGNPGKGPK